MKQIRLWMTAVLFLLAGKGKATDILVDVTAYTSSARETDSTPYVTATGSRTRLGVIALSRDLVRHYGYGSRIVFIRWVPRNGCNPRLIPKIVFRAEDTTSSRYILRVDVWLNSLSRAISFGKCRAVIRIQKTRR